MSRKGENIYRRKDGRWEGRCVQGRNADGSYKYRYVYAHSYQEARQKLNIEKSKSVRPINPLMDIGNRGGGMKGADEKGEKREQMPPASEENPFALLAEGWLAAQKGQVKESTYIKYWNLVSSYIMPELGGMAWNSINRETIELFCQKMLSSGGKKGEGLSSKTVADILSVISSIFRYASYHGYPMMFDLSAIPIKKETKKMRILSRKEQETLCRFLRSKPNDKDLGLLICLFAGLRLGEICALRWEDISFSEQTIHVRGTMQRIQNGEHCYRSEKSRANEGSAKMRASKGFAKTQASEESGQKTKIIITEPKSSDSIRVIPIPRELMKLLWVCGKGKKGFVLTGREDTFVGPRSMERYFERILQKAGIEKVNFHALRHTFATRCVEMGFDVKSLSEILGHSNVSITMNRYVHPSMELKRENMQRLEELLAVS